MVPRLSAPIGGVAGDGEPLLLAGFESMFDWMVQWHPILNTQETSPGVWRLVDAYGAPYADIELRRVQQGTLVRYRVEFRGEVIAWTTSLRTACMTAHHAFLATMSAGPFQGYPSPLRGDPD